MPTVPQSQRTVAKNTIRAGQVSTDAKLEIFGGGAGLEKVTNALNSAIEGAFDMNDSHDNLEASKAAAQLINAKNQAMYGSQDAQGKAVPGYLQTGGKDATTSIENYKKGFKDSFDKVASGLSNDRQRDKLKSYYNEMNVEMDTVMSRHSSSESQKYDNNETAAAVQAHRDDAIVNYKLVDVPDINDPSGKTRTSKISSSLATQEKLIKEHALRNGYAPDSEFVKQKVIESKTMTHKGVIERMLANDEDLYAKEYLEAIKTKGDVSGGALPDLERLVDAGALRGESQRVTDKILEKKTSMGTALDDARGIEDPKLRDEVTQRIKVRYAEAKTVEEDEEQKSFNSVADQVEQYKSRDKIPMDQWLRLSPAQRSSIDTRISQLNSGKHIVTDQEKYYDLRLMAASPQTRDKFAKMNLYVEGRKHLNDKDYNKLIELQAGIIKNEDSVIGKLDGFRTDSQVVKDTLEGIGIKKKSKPELYSQFATKIDSDVEKWKEINGGKTIPNSELKKIIDNQLIEGTVPGTGFLGVWKTKKRLFQLEGKEQIEIDVDTLPKEDLNFIKRALEKKNRPTTDANIIELYEKVRLNRKS